MNEPEPEKPFIDELLRLLATCPQDVPDNPKKAIEAWKPLPEDHFLKLNSRID